MVADGSAGRGGGEGGPQERTGRLGDGSRFDRAAARGEGYECHWKCSRGFPPGRGPFAGADRGRASGAEEAAVVACNGGDVDVPRCREARAPGKEGGGAIGGTNHARRRGGFIFYEGREAQFECGEWFGRGKSSGGSPPKPPGGARRGGGVGRRGGGGPHPDGEGT